MANNEKVAGEYVKKETVLVVALIALAVGFLGGVVYSSFKPRTKMPVQTPVTPQKNVHGPSVSPEQEGRIQALEQETLRNPNNVGAWTQLGNLYFDTNKFKKAIAAYKKSLELNQNNPNIWTDLGVMYRRSGQPAKAVEAFDKAMEIDPGNKKSRFSKGVVLMHDLDDIKGAILAWEELIKLNPSAKMPSGQPIKDVVERLKKSMD